MRRRSRMGLRAALPAALGVLLAVMAALQYRWLDQIGSAQRQEMREALERQSKAFVDDFDREMASLFRALQGLESPDTAGTADAVVGQLARWRASTRFPGLVDQIFRVVTPRDDSSVPTIERLDTSAGFQAVDWPDRLQPVRNRLGVVRGFTSEERSTQDDVDRNLSVVIGFGGPPVVTSVPALLVWLPTRMALPPPDQEPIGTAAPSRMSLPALPRPERALVVTLDRAYISGTMLPALAETHFDADGPRIAIAGHDGAPIFTRGLDDPRALVPETADMSAPLFTVPIDEAGRPAGDTLLTWTDGRLQADDPATGNRQVLVRLERRAVVGDARVRIGEDRWHLLLQHGAGSLDEAVARARRRNLYLSFGILSVLVAAIGLVMVNARRAERLAAQQMAFVAGVSHELRTPVAIIRSAAENLAEGIVADEAGTRRYGELIGAEGRRLTEMIEHALGYAGLGAGAPMPPPAVVDVAAMLRAATDMTTPLAAQAGCTIHLDVSPEVPGVRASEPALRAAVVNLIGNAAKHAGEGGWIGVTARTLQRGARAYVEIAVSDRGPGIDPGERARIFEPFVRGRRAVERQIQGTGLGLSLVAQTAASIGGSVTVEPAPGQGARFVLLLPAIERPDA